MWCAVRLIRQVNDTHTASQRDSHGKSPGSPGKSTRLTRQVTGLTRQVARLTQQVNETHAASHPAHTSIHRAYSTSHPAHTRIHRTAPERWQPALSQAEGSRRLARACPERSRACVSPPGLAPPYICLYPSAAKRPRKKRLTSLRLPVLKYQASSGLFASRARLELALVRAPTPGGHWMGRRWIACN